ncbi:MAG: hypothetical protein A2583_08085 [Bdellovibrionales bacterium RIFOXYD1_FULL_53_11]|nr:MAG: hypothetical protein A2583_08085 [Bdellovibrionales bacterium RIFOXYD1_FULL_53_11]
MSSTLATNLLFGFIAIIASWVLTGCRIGNNVEYAPPPPPSDESKITGYYETRPTSITIYANHATQASKSIDIGQIPASIAAIYTNPMILVSDNAGTGDARIYDNTANYGQRIRANKDGSMAHYSAGKGTPWYYAECTEAVSLEMKGDYTIFRDPKTIDNRTIRGVIKSRWTYIDQFTGDCAASMKEMAECYADFVNCKGKDEEENQKIQKLVAAAFEFHIKNGLITIDDIPAITSLAIEFSYD